MVLPRVGWQVQVGRGQATARANILILCEAEGNEVQPLARRASEETFTPRLRVGLRSQLDALAEATSQCLASPLANRVVTEAEARQALQVGRSGQSQRPLRDAHAPTASWVHPCPTLPAGLVPEMVADAVKSRVTLMG